MPQDKSVATTISFCPQLGLYHYTRADGSDFLFDTAKLEQAIDGYLKSGDTRLADFMAALTSAARLNPHRIVSFDEEGKCTLSDPSVEPTPEETSEPSKTG